MGRSDGRSEDWEGWGASHGLRTTNEGIMQRCLKNWANALALPKSFGVGVNFRLFPLCVSLSVGPAIIEGLLMEHILNVTRSKIRGGG